MGKFIRRLQYLLNLRRNEAELAEEIENHRAMEHRRLERGGIPAQLAAYASRRTLGNVTLAREDARGVWIWPVLEQSWRDLRHGVRVLRHHRTFAATAILTLALGVGATTTVLSLVEAELWRPLPFPHANRLAAVYTTGPGPRETGESVSAPDFLDWRAQTQAFEELSAFRWSRRSVMRAASAGGDSRAVGNAVTPESVRVLPVTSNFFATLRRQPALGRSFGPEEDRAGPAIILSDAGWRRLFGADPQAVGRAVTLDDQPHVIVGVTAADARLEFLPEPDLFVSLDPSATKAADRGRRDLNVIGRLKDGVEVARADADLRTIAQRLAHDYPADHVGRSARVQTLHEAYTGYNWRPLIFFLGAAVFVLLLSCVNVANLVLARALARQREFAIRGALGGGRAALIRQLGVEGSLIALPGAGLGLLLTAWAVRIIPSWLPPGYLNRGGAIGVDGRVVAVALGVSVLTAVVFGLAPMWFAGRRDLISVLGHGARLVTGSRRERLARQALVVAEVTIALVLLFGAGLFLNSFVRLTRMPLGFDPRDRVTIGVSLTGTRYQDSREVLRFATELVERAEAVPGVRAAAAANDVPLGSGQSVRFVAADQPRPAAGSEPSAIVRAVSPAFFRVLDIRRLLGREFTADDADGAARVAVINERLARRLFAGRDPVGSELVLIRSSAAWVTTGTVRIVGVVANVKDVGMNEVDFNDIYLPIAQARSSSIQLIASTAVPPSGVVEGLRRLIHGLDPRLPVIRTTTMAQRVDDALRSDRFHLLLIGMLAVIAVALASVGIYGIMSYTVEQRTQEFGVRIALGAGRSGILGLALGQSMRLAMAGTVLGLAASLGIGKVLGSALYMVPGEHEGVLYGVHVADPLTLACACASLIGVAVLAAWIPARRATEVDPIVALRCD